MILWLPNFEESLFPLVCCHIKKLHQRVRCVYNNFTTLSVCPPPCGCLNGWVDFKKILHLHYPWVGDGFRKKSFDQTILKKNKFWTKFFFGPKIFFQKFFNFSKKIPFKMFFWEKLWKNRKISHKKSIRVGLMQFVKKNNFGRGSLCPSTTVALDHM